MPGWDALWAGGGLPDLHLPPDFDPGAVRMAFADQLYGAPPPRAEKVTVTPFALADDTAEGLRLTLRAGGVSITVDAAIWHPPGPCNGVVIGLDFIGPAGQLRGTGFPLDPKARAYTDPSLGAEGRLTDTLRGRSAARWPLDLFAKHGLALITSCYGSWAPDDPQLWRSHGLATLWPAQNCGTIAFWAGAFSKLLDAAEHILGAAPERAIAAGHSRLGKAALWAGVWDNRFTDVFANNSGCAGAAPEAHAIGETRAQLAQRFPHWLKPGANQDLQCDLDQHSLLATLAPRRVYLANAIDDAWADPLGQIAALSSASSAWGQPWPHEIPHVVPALPWQQVHGTLGHHIRPGGHDMTPLDWDLFLNAFTGDAGKD